MLSQQHFWSTVQERWRSCCGASAAGLVAGPPRRRRPFERPRKGRLASCVVHSLVHVPYENVALNLGSSERFLAQTSVVLYSLID